MDDSSKSSSCDDDEERANQVEIIWLQMRKQSKFPWRMTTVLRESARMEDILRGSGIRLESGGRITFYPQHGKERANVTLLNDPLNLCKVLRSEDANK